MQSFFRGSWLLALALLFAPSLSAQMTVEATPFFGFTLPQGELCCGGALGDDVSQKLQASPAIGAALALRRGQLALEGMVLFSPTTQTDKLGFGLQSGGEFCVQPNCSGNAIDVPFTNDDQSLTFFTASILWYPGSNPVFEPYLAVGAGLRQLSQGDVVFGRFYGTPGWEDSTSDMALGIGGGLRFHYDDKISIRIDARDWISSFDWDEPSEDNDTELQNDIIVSTGISIVLGGN